MWIAVVVLFAAFMTTVSARAQQGAENQAVVIGPWRIETALRKGKFDYCSMTRTLEDVSATVMRAGDGLTLILNSPKWKLERGKQYPVQMVAGSRSWSTRVTAERDAVTIALTDPAFIEALRKAEILGIKGEGSTIAVSLDRSAAALDRLEACYEKNSRSTEINPFVAPGRQP
jgi:hypothetical protein